MISYGTPRILTLLRGKLELLHRLQVVLLGLDLREVLLVRGVVDVDVLLGLRHHYVVLVLAVVQVLMALQVLRTGRMAQHSALPLRVDVRFVYRLRSVQLLRRGDAFQVECQSELPHGVLLLLLLLLVVVAVLGHEHRVLLQLVQNHFLHPTLRSNRLTSLVF